MVDRHLVGGAMPPDPRLGTDLGPFHIESLIGRGGMGVVYLATHTGLERRVALKLLTPDYADDEGFRARFLRESKLAASIDHPNIIPVYDAGEIDGTFYLAMRYVEGVDLESRLRAGPLAPREAVHLLAQVASALDAAHEAGLVHRDVKPANVLIATRKSVDRADHAYLTDFGLTKHRGSQSGLTQAGGFIGTLEYIAPEQIEGRTVDGRADQYALAAIAVGCLTGEPPFPRESDVATINAHLHDPPPSVHERRPELPGGVDAVISRGLAKRPDDRYPDCKAFVDELRTALRVTDTQTRPAPASIRERRVAFGLGLLLVLGLVAVVGIGLASGGGPLPSLRPSTGVAVTSPSSSLEASPTGDVFPNVDEAALLASLPEDLGATCGPGSREPLAPGWRAPNASIACLPGADTGANSVLIRQYRRPLPGDSTLPQDFLRFFAGTRRIAEGDCATTERARGPWRVAGRETGAILCYVDPPSGDAILYWTYDDQLVLVKAVNQRGDSGALYEFFQANARFITP
jgi:serine/threonine-protein kinase